MEPLSVPLFTYISKLTKMKREFFIMIFIIMTIALLFMAEHFATLTVLKENLYRFIVIWILIAVYAGQYSMRFTKAF